jgi:hypothetical protein
MLSSLIFDLIEALLRLNDRLYGRSASYELCRDLCGMWRPVDERRRLF